MNHDGANAHLTSCALDTQGYLAAIGDQDLSKHGYQAMMKSGCPYSTGWPLSTRMAFTVPDLSHSISFISFIASMMQMICPSFTLWPTSTKGLASGEGVR